MGFHSKNVAALFCNMFFKVSKAYSCDLNENQTEAEVGKKGKSLWSAFTACYFNKL